MQLTEILWLSAIAIYTLTGVWITNIHVAKTQELLDNWKHPYIQKIAREDDIPKEVFQERIRDTTSFYGLLVNMFLWPTLLSMNRGLGVVLDAIRRTKDDKKSDQEPL
jgi:hypothetical protein